MSTTVSQIIKLGKALPREERELLVDELLASLNEPTAGQLDAVWEGEIERRLTAYDNGDVQSLSAEEVFAKARALAK